MSEFTTDDRPDWLPKKFDTPEALAASYAELERKFHETTQINASLRDALETETDLHAQTIEPAHVQSDAPQYDPVAINTMAALAAQQAAAQYAPISQPAAQSPADLVAAQGIALAESSVPSFADHRTELAQLFDSSPEWFAELNRASQTSPAAVAGVLGSAISTLEAAGQLQHGDTRAMKFAAQSISGGQSGRPDADSGEQAWQKIVAAGRGDYASMMRGR
jgi:hypothetical protein